MSQEHGPEELSAEDIAHRIGPVPAVRAKGIAERVGAIRAVPPEPVRPPAPPAVAFPTRIATQRLEPWPAKPGSELQPVNPLPRSVIDLPGPRHRLIRDTAATLAGLSAVVLIVLAVAPPSPDGGVLGVTGTPSVATESASQTGSLEPTATPTPEPTPTPDATGTPRP